MHYIAGINSLSDALKKRLSIKEIYIDERKKSQRIDSIITESKNRQVPIKFLSKIKIDILVPGTKHQGVVGLVDIDKHSTLDDILQIDNPLILCLDSIQDPHNLGACLRSAAAANVDAVIVPKDRAAKITPIVSKVASGGAEIVPIFRVANLSRTLEKCQKKGLWVVALAGKATKTIYQIDFNIGCIILMGNEGDGVSSQLLKQSDYLANIPMPGDIESLNVSVATGITLFECNRQRSLCKL